MSGNCRSRSLPGMKAYDPRSQNGEWEWVFSFPSRFRILGIDFLFPSASRILGMVFIHSIPRSRPSGMESPILVFLFPNSQKSFLLTPGLSLPKNKIQLLSKKKRVAHLALDHPLSADLDPWLAERLDHLERIDLERASHLAGVTWIY